MAQLAVSFDPALVRLLREVRYFLMLPQLSADIPETAIKVRMTLIDFCSIFCRYQVIGLLNHVL